MHPFPCRDGRQAGADLENHSPQNQPVKEFLTNRPREDRKEIGGDIYKIQEGFPIGLPLVRKVDTDLWEVQSIIPDGICRILFALRV
jgi:phage-related protein